MSPGHQTPTRQGLYSKLTGLRIRFLLEIDLEHQSFSLDGIPDNERRGDAMRERASAPR